MAQKQPRCSVNFFVGLLGNGRGIPLWVSDGPVYITIQGLMDGSKPRRTHVAQSQLAPRAQEQNRVAAKSQAQFEDSIY